MIIVQQGVIMTVEKAHKIFSEIIWNSELSNMTLSEYLDTYPSENRLWIETEKLCIKHGINLWIVQCK